jgi:hypothetical protein
MAWPAVPEALRDRIAAGTGLTIIASAAAAAMGLLAVPVYEIYKARQTVHEWLARYANEGGLGGLADRSSRPLSCPHQMPAVVEARIVGLRREDPGWGPSRIRWELERAGAEPLPGRSAVYRALISQLSMRIGAVGGP